MRLSFQSKLTGAASWCTNYAPYDADPAGIQNGLLFPYNTSLAIYHCPADRSKVQPPGQPLLPLLRWRSYNMSLCINGTPDLDPYNWYSPCFKRLTEIKDPDPARLFVFLDVHEDEIMDCTFGMPNQQFFGDAQTWWDIPANRHSQGANLAFGDGHAEYRKWRVPKSYRGFLPQSVPAAELPDYRWMQDGYKQRW